MSTLPQAIDLGQKLGLFSDPWNPRIIAELNGQHVKLAKLDGAFDWHRHTDEDELFLVLRGNLRIEFEQGAVELAEGQMLVVPRGLLHRPVAREEVSVLLFEPASTVNTGDATSARTVRAPERL